MDFPTIKKPKSKKLEGAKSFGGDFKSTIDTYEGDVPSTKKLPGGFEGAKKVPEKPFEGSRKPKSQFEGSKSFSLKDADYIPEADSLAENAMKAIGGDKSDKAEAIRARALLVKGKNKKKKFQAESIDSYKGK